MVIFVPILLNLPMIKQLTPEKVLLRIAHNSDNLA